MKNIYNEEKSFKRFLKRKLSFNLENLVKLLITGTLAFSITACGGGGGSSTSVRKNIPTLNEINHVIDNLKDTIDDINHKKQETDKVIKDINKAKSEIDKINPKDIKNEKDLNDLIENIDETRRLKEKAKKELEKIKNKDDAKKIEEEIAKINELEKSLEDLKDEVYKNNELNIGDKTTYEVEPRAKAKILVGTITGGESYPELFKNLEKRYEDLEDNEPKLDPNDPSYEEKKKKREKEKREDEEAEKNSKIGLLIKDKNFKTRSKINIDMKNIDQKNSYGVWAIESDFENLGNISIGNTKNYPKHPLAILGFDSNIVNYGNIEVFGSDVASIQAYQTKANLKKKIINRGVLKSYGDYAGGIYVGNGITAINEGVIETYGNHIGGLGAENANLINKGTILLEGDNSHGISIEIADQDKELEVGNFVLENYGDIKIEGNNSVGMRASYLTRGVEEKSTVTLKNFGNITVDGTNENNTIIYDYNKFEKTMGMVAKGKLITAINHGIINVKDEGYGMAAFNGATAINAKDGIINIKGSTYRMVAEKGANVSDEKKSNSIKYIEKGTAIKKAGMFADKDSTIKNLGTINIEDELKVSSTFSVDTDRSGGYGKITAKAVQMDADINVSSEITKKDYKEKYELKNIVKTDKLKTKENLKAKTDSILYSARSIVDNNAMSVALYRTNKYEDFVSPYLKDMAKIWDKVMNKQNRSEKISDILDLVDTTSKKKVEEALYNIYPNIYSNLAREIYSKNKLFNSKDKLAINNLYGNKYGFVLLNEYKDIKNYNYIPGYKTNQSGFVGTLDLGNNLYGNIGYAYDDIKYKENGNSKIHTIHLGLNKDTKINDINLELALSGEYNFHKNTREMKKFDTVAKSKFNSYSIGTSAKISKKFGDDLYIKPFSKIELAYMKHEEFTEKNAGVLNTKFNAQSYTSFLPQIGFKLGRDFENISLFTDLTYGYELGNLNKAEEFHYENKDLQGSSKLVKDDLEKNRLSVKVGANYHRNNFTAGLNLGKDFDKRGNKFINFSLSYKF